MIHLIIDRTGPVGMQRRLFLASPDLAYGPIGVQVQETLLIRQALHARAGPISTENFQGVLIWSWRERSAYAPPTDCVIPAHRQRTAFSRGCALVVVGECAEWQDWHFHYQRYHSVNMLDRQ